MAATKDIRKSIDLVEGTDIESADEEVLAESVDNEMRNRWKKRYIQALVNIGHSEKDATENYEKMLHVGPEPGSSLHKSINEFLNFGRSKI